MAEQRLRVAEWPIRSIIKEGAVAVGHSGKPSNCTNLRSMFRLLNLQGEGVPGSKHHESATQLMSPATPMFEPLMFESRV